MENEKEYILRKQRQIGLSVIFYGVGLLAGMIAISIKPNKRNEILIVSGLTIIGGIIYYNKK